MTPASIVKEMKINSSEKIEDEKILAALGPSFLERYLKGRAC
jgi:hypothetical protein